MEIIITKEQSEEIIISPGLNTFMDKKTGVQTVAFTFQFPSGDKGIVAITKLRKGKWNVEEDIKSLTIKYQ